MHKKTKVLKLLIPLAVALFMVYQMGCNQSGSSDSTNNTEKNVKADFSGFPDFGVMISPDSFATYYPGQKVFSLRQNYPTVMPGADQIPGFFKMPFDDKAKWIDWLMAVREHCFEGMIDVDFVPQLNKKHDWYQVPWLHYGDSANGWKSSEGFHGLAKEININPYQLAPEQSQEGQTYAIGFYNSFAGYVLHKMWKDPTAPDAWITQGPKGGFPVGTVIFKLLFTDLDSTQAPFLKNPFAWDAFISPTWLANNRVVKKVNLIQMDIMVRDAAADKYGTGWIFGTFCYNGALNKGKTMKERVMNLVPVGIQFGNDPDYKTNFINPYPVTKTIINDSLKQTFINPSSDLPPQHLGWGSRLDGIVDLNTASCMSCHATGEFPQLSAVVPAECFIGKYKYLPNNDSTLVYLTETNSPAFTKYFTNTRCATAYDPGNAVSTDFSLQVSLSLQYFWQWKNRMLRGYYADEYNSPVYRVGRDFELKKNSRKLK